MMPSASLPNQPPAQPEAIHHAIHRAMIAQGVCSERTHRRGDVLFHAGAPATALHLVTNGQVKLVLPTSDGNERILAVLGEGELIGASFLLQAGHYRVDAVAVCDTTTCLLGREQFLRLASERPELLFGFSGMLMERLFHAWDLLGTSYAPVQTRLARVLLEQSEHFGRSQADGWLELTTSLNHEEMAAMIAATRVSVSGAMNELRRLGALQGTRGRYRIHLPSLRTLAER